MTEAIHPTTVPNHFGSYDELDLLSKLIRQEKVILWVGSGFSSYAGYPTGSQLPSLMLSCLGELPDGAPNPGSTSLQEAADYYVEQKERSGLNSFLVEQYGKDPSRCDIHKSLALINRVKYVVTTNFDPLFERAYGDKIFVISQDVHLPGSTEYPDKTILLKIHGDITQPDTIVITSEDYRKFNSETIVWSNIRTLLAKYSVVFIGYSLHDPNVEKMLGDIDARLKGKKHPYFFIDWKIDDTKRKELASYNLHFIEMDAAAAIGYITGNTIQYAFVDGMKHPSLLAKSDQIFDSRGFHVEHTIKGGKLTRASFIPKRPDIHSKFTLSLSSKTGDRSEFRALHDYITGFSFEPVTIGAPMCEIEIRDAEINGVFVIDPSIKKLKKMMLMPQPRGEITSDLELHFQPIRLRNLKTKIFLSAVLSKFEIEEHDFKLSFTIPYSTGAGKLTFSIPRIMTDIDRARIVYSLLVGWIQGDSIELLSDKLPQPIKIPSSPNIRDSPDSLLIHAFQELYTDLYDIETILKIKLSVPEKITAQDQKNIRQVSAFVRGHIQSENYLMTTFSNTEAVRSHLFSKGYHKIIISDWDEFLIFGKAIKVPIAIEGLDLLPVNDDEIRASIDRGDDKLQIVWKSDTGHLHKKFDPDALRGANSQPKITKGCM